MVDRISESGINYDSTPNSFSYSGAGEFPYRSGIHKDMYKERPWTIRQYAGFGNTTEANHRLKSLIESGVNGLSIAFDLQMVSLLTILIKSIFIILSLVHPFHE